MTLWLWKVGISLYNIWLQNSTRYILYDDYFMMTTFSFLFILSLFRHVCSFTREQFSVFPQLYFIEIIYLSGFFTFVFLLHNPLATTSSCIRLYTSYCLFNLQGEECCLIVPLSRVNVILHFLSFFISELFSLNVSFILRQLHESFYGSTTIHVDAARDTLKVHSGAMAAIASVQSSRHRFLSLSGNVRESFIPFVEIQTLEYTQSSSSYPLYPYNILVISSCGCAYCRTAIRLTIVTEAR